MWCVFRRDKNLLRVYKHKSGIQFGVFYKPLKLSVPDILKTENLKKIKKVPNIATDFQKPANLRC